MAGLEPPPAVLLPSPTSGSLPRHPDAGANSSVSSLVDDSCMSLACSGTTNCAGERESARARVRPETSHAHGVSRHEGCKCHRREHTQSRQPGQPMHATQAGRRAHHVTSLFFSQNPFAVYSTSPAKCTTVNVLSGSRRDSRNRLAGSRAARRDAT